MANRVVHFEVQADNIERAKSFYEQAFGWEIQQMKTKDEIGMDYWGLNTGDKDMPGINGGLYQRPKDKKINTFDCTIAVENIDEAIEKVKNAGGKIEGDKSEILGVGWLVRAVDTEGNIFGMIQPTNWQP